MKLKNLGAAVVLALALVANAFAQDREPKIIVNSQLFSQYMGVNGGIFHNNRVVQSDATYVFAYGLSVNVWHSGASRTLNSNYGDEIDYSVHWAHSSPWFDINVGVVYIDVFKLGEMPTGDVVFPYFQVGRTFSVFHPAISLTPFIRMENYFPAKGNIPKSGNAIYLGMSGSWKISEKLSSGFKTNTYHDLGGAFDFEPGVLLQGNIVLKYQLFENLGINGSMKFSKPIYEANKIRKQTLVWFTGLTFSY